MEIIILGATSKTGKRSTQTEVESLCQDVFPLRRKQDLQWWSTNAKAILSSGLQGQSETERGAAQFSTQIRKM